MEGEMAEKSGASPRRKEGKDLSLVQDPTVRELLDHIADELAGEYVRLMKEASREGSGSDIKGVLK